MKPDFIDNLELPVVAAPMFLISGPKLVIECCKNGIIGTFPALNQKTTEGFESWVIEIKESLEKFKSQTGKTPAPFGVNLIVHPTNPRVMPDLEVCVRHKVPLIITSLGAVSDLVNTVHSYGGLVFHDIVKRRHAEKAREAGVDGLILVAAGAGGHAGTINPLALINEIKTFFDKEALNSAMKLSDHMISYWTQFAYTGDPGMGRDSTSPEWKPWSEEDTYIVLDSDRGQNISMRNNIVSWESLVQDLTLDTRLSNKEKCEILYGGSNEDDGYPWDAFNEFEGGYCLSLDLSYLDRGRRESTEGDNND